MVRCVIRIMFFKITRLVKVGFKIKQVKEMCYVRIKQYMIYYMRYNLSYTIFKLLFFYFFDNKLLLILTIHFFHFLTHFPTYLLSSLPIYFFFHLTLNSDHHHETPITTTNSGRYHYQPPTAHFSLLCLLSHIFCIFLVSFFLDTYIQTHMN